MATTFDVIRKVIIDGIDVSRITRRVNIDAPANGVVTLTLEVQVATLMVNSEERSVIVQTFKQTFDRKGDVLP